MLPATKAVPKEMLPVAGKPLIQYAVEEAAASGIETVIFVVRDYRSVIQQHFAPDDSLESFLRRRGLVTSANLVHNLSRIAKLKFVRQSKPLGLAHAVSCARPFVGNDPFVVLLPDVIIVNREPVARQLIRAHEETEGSVVAVREVEPQDVQRFGIVQVESAAGRQSRRLVRLTGLVEKPTAHHAPSRLGVFGRYLLQRPIWNAIAQTSPDASGEVQLTDALNLLCQKHPVFGVRFEGQHYDAGHLIGCLKANLDIALQDPHLRGPLLHHVSALHERAGVSAGSPSSTRRPSALGH